LLLEPLVSAALAQQLAGALPVHVAIHADQPGATIDRRLYGSSPSTWDAGSTRECGSGEADALKAA